MPHPSLHVEIWLCAFDGRPPAFREFIGAHSCEADGTFLRVTDADGANHWYPATTITKASATPHCAE